MFQGKFRFFCTMLMFLLSFPLAVAAQTPTVELLRQYSACLDEATLGGVEISRMFSGVMRMPPPEKATEFLVMPANGFENANTPEHFYLLLEGKTFEGVVSPRPDPEKERTWKLTSTLLTEPVYTRYQWETGLVFAIIQRDAQKDLNYSELALASIKPELFIKALREAMIDSIHSDLENFQKKAGISQELGRLTDQMETGEKDALTGILGKINEAEQRDNQTNLKNLEKCRLVDDGIFQAELSKYISILGGSK